MGCCNSMKSRSLVAHRAAHAAEFFDHSQAAERQVGFRVAAFVDHHQASAGMPLGRVADHRGHRPEAVAVQLHACQRVHRVGVEATGDHDQLRAEALQRRQHDALHGLHVGVVTAAGKQRHVEVEATTAILADVFGAAVARREAAVLVQGNAQHVVAPVVDRLGAVAVVHVPVQHRDPLDAVARFGRLDGHGDVGEETEAHRLVRQAVVTRRPRQRSRRCPPRRRAPRPARRWPGRRRAGRSRSCPGRSARPGRGCRRRRRSTP